MYTGMPYYDLSRGSRKLPQNTNSKNNNSRTIWPHHPESIDKIKAKGRMNEEGYINVAEELGLSGSRGNASIRSPSVIITIFLASESD